MAQSRIDKAASIFTRANGLIKSKLIPWNERPLWFDIYKSFPPDRDPTYRSVLGKEDVPALPRKIFYKEDYLRAYYFKNITPVESVVLNSTLTKPVWELFIECYQTLSKKGISKENLIEASVEEMQNKGFFMQLKGKTKEKTAEIEGKESNDDLKITLQESIKNILQQQEAQNNAPSAETPSSNENTNNTKNPSTN